MVFDEVVAYSAWARLGWAGWWWSLQTHSAVLTSCQKSFKDCLVFSYSFTLALEMASLSSLEL